MKKGLRRSRRIPAIFGVGSMSRPDEEGITTLKATRFVLPMFDEQT